MRIDTKHTTQPGALLRGFGLLTIAMLTMSGTIVTGSAAQAVTPTPAEQPTELGAPQAAGLNVDVFYFRRATMDPVTPGEVVTITTQVNNRGDATFTEDAPVKFTDDLAKTLNQADLLEDSFTSTIPGWTMGALSGDSKLPISGPLDEGESATLTYQVQVKNLADLNADFILDSDSAGDLVGVQCGGECWTYTPIEKSLSITPANSTTMYSQKVTYEAVITDGFDAERTVTDDTSFTSQAGTMADNVLTVQMIGTGFETVATYGQFTATATVNGTASTVPAVTINPSNGSTISGTGVTGNTVVVTLPGGNEQTVVVVDGKWSITPSQPLANGDLVTVSQTDSKGFSSPAATVTIDQAKPNAPKVNTSNGKTITGGPIATGNSLAFTDDQQNPIAGELVIDPQTGLFTFTPVIPLNDGDTVNVVATSPAGNSSDATTVDFVTTPPTTPSVETSNGKTITGGPVGKDDVVTVLDGTGKNIPGTVEVDSEGNFTFTPTTPLTDNDTASVVVTGPSGIESTPAVVDLVTKAPAAPSVNISNGTTVTGGTIASTDTVTIVDGDGKKIPGTVEVDVEGNFVFTPTQPLTEDDTAKVIVTGPSGLVSTPKNIIVVTKAPNTPAVKPSTGITITGGPVGKNDTVTVVDGEGKAILGTVDIDEDGNFTFTPATPLTDDDTAKVIVTGPSGLESIPADVDLVTNAPATPSVNTSNGITITGGTVGKDDVVSVLDGEGKKIPGTVKVDDKGNFTFTPVTPLTDTDTAQVVVTGPSGLKTQPVDVDLVTKAPAVPMVKPSDGKTITGGPVGKDDVVTVVDGDGKDIPGSVEVDENGNFTFTPTTPLTEDNTAKVVVTGPSGLETETGNIDIVTKAPTTPVVKPSDGKTITGGPIGKDDKVTVVDGDGKDIPGELVIDGDGNFTFTPTTPLTEDDTAKVVVTGPSGIETETGNIDIVTTAPTAPTVKPSDGKTITGGTVGKDDKVTVVDGDGKDIPGTVEVDGDGNFTFTPTKPLTEDDAAKVIVTGPSGLETETDNIEIVTKAPTTPVVKPSDGKTITGGPVGKDDVVTVVDSDGKTVPGELVIDGDGNFTFTPTTPLTEDDTAKVIVTGPSGIETETGTVDVVTTAPPAPALKPSNGKTIAGGPVAEGETVIVLDGEDNEILGSVDIDDKGNFVFTPKTPLTEGDVAKVIVVGPSELHSEATDVVLDFVAPDAPLVNPSNGSVIAGAAEAGSTVKVYDANDKLIGQATAGDDGAFTIVFDPALGNKEALTVTATDAAGNESKATALVIDSTVPAVPTVKPSDGKTVTGCAQPGSTVTVSDAAGNVIGTAIAGDDCSYTVTLTPVQTPGSKVSIVVTSPSGVSSEAITLSVGAVSMKLESIAVAQGENQIAYGYGFQPGEVVAGMMHSTPFDLGTQVADADGAVTFEFAVPADAEIGSHSVKLTGAFSGEISQEFAVTAATSGKNTAVEAGSDPTSLALTGSDPMLMLSSGLLMLLLGSGLVLVLRKRSSAVTAK